MLLNILGFGLVDAAYFNPQFALAGTLDLGVWAVVDVLAEGAMRGLFSMLFGVGVILFATGSAAKSKSTYFRRQFLLLLFGLVDAFVLLWSGDILLTYALAACLLYWVRETRPGLLLTAALLLLVLLSLFHGATGFAMQEFSSDPDFIALEADFAPSAEQIAQQLTARNTSYISAFVWSASVTLENFLFAVPAILLWDALAMMLLGMALYRYGIMTGQGSDRLYWLLMLLGFFVGLLVNSYEAWRAYASNFAMAQTFAFAQPTYHLGRLAMALGYMALVVLWCRGGLWVGLRHRLAAVGRLALTNYLMHSFIALVLFTGLGFGWVNVLTRSQLYGVVLLIWLLQLWFSPWWLQRYRFGPLEWLWRGLTYGSWPQNRRA